MVCLRDLPCGRDREAESEGSMSSWSISVQPSEPVELEKLSLVEAGEWMDPLLDEWTSLSWYTRTRPEPELVV